MEPLDKLTKIVCSGKWDVVAETAGTNIRALCENLGSIRNFQTGAADGIVVAMKAMKVA